MRTVVLPYKQAALGRTPTTRCTANPQQTEVEEFILNSHGAVPAGIVSLLEDKSIKRRIFGYSRPTRETRRRCSSQYVLTMSSAYWHLSCGHWHLTIRDTIRDIHVNLQMILSRRYLALPAHLSIAHYTGRHRRQPRRGCRGRIPTNILVGGDINGNVPTNILGGN